jgi:hypothetical protein
LKKGFFKLLFAVGAAFSRDKGLRAKKPIAAINRFQRKLI